MKADISEVTEKVIGRRKCKTSEKWISNDTWTLIDKRKTCKQQINQNDDKKQEYKAIDKLVKESARKDKERWLDLNISKAQAAADRNDTRTVYKVIKELSGTSNKTQIQIKDKDGHPLNCDHDIQQRWMEHFEAVLNQPEPNKILKIEQINTTINEIETGKITYNETKIAIDKLKKNKSPGMDNIYPEMIKFGGEPLVSSIQHLCNRIWEQEKIPEEWEIGTIIPLPNKGDLCVCSNWRGITLLSIPSKVLSIIILNRMKKAVEKVLRDEQSGFRSGRSCTDAIFALKTIIEKANEYNTPFFITS